MSAATELLHHLIDKGVQLHADGDRLLFEAPAAVLTESLRDRVSAEKAALLELLRRRAESGFQRRADLLIAEFDGDRPRPNESVHREVDEARTRFSAWPSTRPTITAWLRTYAPEVAARWPEAPLSAAWFEWRKRVGPDDVPTLDRSLVAVTNSSTFRTTPKRNSSPKK